jgi:hypothetical protein
LKIIIPTLYLIIISSLLSCTTTEMTNTEKSHIKVRYADRRYITSILTDVYGIKNQNIINNRVWFRPDVFGYSCDPYEEVWVFTGKRNGDPQKKLNDEFVKCPRGLMDGKVSALAVDSNLRRSLINKVCNELTDSMSVVSNPLLKSEINQGNLQALYEKFFPYQQLSKRKSSQIRKSLSEDLSLEDKWRNITFALCINKKWQIL